MTTTPISRNYLKTLTLCLCVIALSFSRNLDAQPYQPSAENMKSRAWFQEARFGLFIHWGVYSILGDGEWVMNNQQIPISTYEKLPGAFNPSQFDAKSIVQMAKDAGMKYITFTSKHHDGFSMFDSKVSDYTIVKKTPFGRDVVKELAEECQKQGIKLFLYHSQLDWHHPDYFPRGFTGGSYTGREEKGDMNKYLDYMDAQLTELLTNYGPIGGIWFDGMWDKKDAEWRLRKTYDMIHRLQPAAMVGSNHHLMPFEGEDFQMFEKDLPGNNTTGFAPEQKIGDLPRETCETINNSWGFDLRDNHNKSYKDLVQYLVKAAGYDANFLLNVGPMSNGKIQPEHVALLKQIGEWTRTHGETIYGTHGGPLTPRTWGVTTQRGNQVYVHILNWPDESLTLPKFGKKVTKVTLFHDKSPIKFVANDFGVTFKVDGAKRNDVDTIVVLTVE